MIIIKASGAAGVRELRRLAKSLSAEPMEMSAEDVAPPSRPARKGSKPSVSTLAGAHVSGQTGEAIMTLRPAGVEAGGDYDLS